MATPSRRQKYNEAASPSHRCQYNEWQMRFARAVDPIKLFINSTKFSPTNGLTIYLMVWVQCLYLMIFSATVRVASASPSVFDSRGLEYSGSNYLDSDLGYEEDYRDEQLLGGPEDFDPVVESLKADAPPDWITAPDMVDVEGEGLGQEGSSLPPPTIIKAPQHQWVVKRNPANLTCRALYADRISFKCNKEWVKEHLHTTAQGVDAESGQPFLQSSIQIHRKLVVLYHGMDQGYQCVCYAWRKGGGTIKSEPALVKEAYLKKHFYSEPADERKPLGATISLPCLPPDGEPKPTTFWMKDGQQIKRLADTNVIVGHDGSLLISSARLNDSGNYSCGAHNVARDVLTKPVTVNIYRDGGWSLWSDWVGTCESGCSELARRLKRKRYRKCNNPEPVGGGKICVGSNQETQNCGQTCPVDGAWSEWSDWSQCEADCQQFRTRSCDRPTPKNAGRACPGKPRNVRICSTDFCRPAVGVPASSRPGQPLLEKRGSSGAGLVGPGPASSSPGGSVRDMGSDPLLDKTTAMYVGIGVAFSVVLVLLAFIVYLLKRKGSRQDVYYATPPPHMTQVLKMQPDVAQNALLMNEEQFKKYPPGDPSYAAYMGGPPLVPPSQPAHRSLRTMEQVLSGSKAPLLVDGCANNSGGSHPSSLDSGSSVGGDKHPRSASQSSQRSSSHEEPPYASLYDAVDCYHLPDLPESKEERQNNRNSMISAVLPDNFDVENLAWGVLGPAGGQLSIPDSGVSLLVPEGALVKPQELFLAVCPDASDRPKIADKETLVSPVLLLGPPTATFAKPVVLSFSHAAQLLPLNNWLINVYGCEATPEDNNSDWTLLTTVGDETINTPVFVQLDLDRCHMMTELPGRFALVGRARAGSQDEASGTLACGQRPVKRMRLAVFAPQHFTSQDYSLRVYCVEDTEATLQCVIKEEEQRIGGFLAHEPKDFSFQEGANLCFCLEDVAPGWQIKQGANYQEIPFEHVWSGPPDLHCAFSLEAPGAAPRSPSDVSVRLLVYQKAQANSHRQVLYINIPVNPQKTGSIRSGYSSRRPDSAAPSVISTADCGSHHQHSPSVRFSSNTVFRIPSHVRRKICALLDEPTEDGRDWRMLAHKLCVDRYIQFFATKPSPTESILDLWEARHRDPAAASDLAQLLRSIQRPDLAGLLETAFFGAGQGVPV